MILFLEAFTSIDFSRLIAGKEMRGETWLADLEIEGEVGKNGMVADFSPLKKTAKELLDALCDHKLAVPVKSHAVKVSVKNKRAEISMKIKGQTFSYLAPAEAVCLVDGDDITPAALSRMLTPLLRLSLPAGIKRVKLTFRSAPQSEGALFRYSHGLKFHGGNCQRMAHGHRGLLTIYKGAKRELLLEKKWSRFLDGRFIGAKSDVVSETPKTMKFQYKAVQGEFTLELPKDQAVSLSAPPTVENIALYIRSQLVLLQKARWKVKVFEGHAKGALAD